MPLSAASPVYLHLLQNLSLITLSLFFAPLCTLITTCSLIAGLRSTAAKRDQRNQQCSSAVSSRRPRVVLVTGVGMSKGLSIARAFYREGNHVIGADFEPNGVPVCGRFSMALKKFYRLSKPVPSPEGSRPYVDGILNIIKRENVDLWISCSGVAFAIEDAKAAEVIDKQSNCKSVQLGAGITKILDEKHSFIEQTRCFGLNVPETHFIISTNDALSHLYSEETHKTGRKFIMKSVGLDDTIRADMTLLPRHSLAATEDHLTRLKPSSSRPFVLQQFINGREYCTHSVIVRGRVAIFTACPSAELLMHYKALPPTSALSRAMQSYTEMYAEKMGNVTGHFSIDFMLDENDSGLKFIDRLYPIECNPRAHTAVVLFEENNKAMVDAYMSVLEDDGISATKIRPVVSPSITTSYYWVGHDTVTFVLLPLFSRLVSRTDLSSLIGKWKDFLEHVVFCKDGTYVVWDPLPFWWLYCVYWPGMFVSAIVTQDWWSRCNVSTTKMFRC